MDTLPKLYLTGALIINMAITNYCYNSYGFTPDYNFFRFNKAVSTSTAPVSEKVQFLKNYTPTYDNVVSAMAIMDETVSRGALYYDYRKTLDKKIYIDGINFQVPDSVTNIKPDFQLKNTIDYAGENNTAVDIYHNNVYVAQARINNDCYYRLSSSVKNFAIDGVTIGDNILNVIQKWGQPTENTSDLSVIYKYSVGDKAEITLLTASEGNITWMLYEGLKTELLNDDVSTEITTGEASTIVSKKPKKDKISPVAEKILKEHKK